MAIRVGTMRSKNPRRLPRWNGAHTCEKEKWEGGVGALEGMRDSSITDHRQLQRSDLCLQEVTLQTSVLAATASRVDTGVALTWAGGPGAP